jgi:hypothetical protein
MGLALGLWFGTLVVVSLTDLLVPLWPALRLTGLLIVVVPAAWAVLTGVIRPLLRRLRPAQMARRIEAHIPGIHNRLVSCIDLKENRKESSCSPAFYRRLVQEALERIRGFRPRTVVNFLHLRRAATFAALSVAGFLLALILFADRLPTAMARIFSPFADIPPASGVTFTVTPGADAKVLRGEDIVFAVEVEKGEAKQFQVKLSSPTGDRPLWHDLKKTDGNRWEVSLNSSALGTGFEHKFNYRIYGGGTWSKEYTVTVLDRPAIASLRTVLHFPEYMGIAEPRVGPPQTADVTGPEESQVEVVVQVEGDVKEGEIQLLEPAPTKTFPMQPKAGSEWSGRFPLRGSGLYRVELRNELGYANKPMKEAKYVAIPDKPPQIVLERPGTDLTLSEPTKLPLVIAAFDDFGLDEVALVYQRTDGGPWERKVVKHYAKPQQSDSIVTNLDLAEMQVKVRETIRYHAEARDRKGQLAKTPDYVIRVNLDSNAADKQLIAFEKSQDPFREKLASLIAEQSKIRDRVEQVAAKYAPVTEKVKAAEAQAQMSEAARKPNAGRPVQPQPPKLDAETERKLQELRKELGEMARQEARNVELGKQINQDLRRTADQATKLSLLPKDIAEQLQALQQAFQQRALDPLQDLANRMNAGANPRERGTDLQQMQQTSDRLQKELEAMRERMKALEEAQKALHKDMQEAIAKLKEDMLRQQGGLTARDLEDLKNFIAALQKELENQQGMQEDLQKNTEAAADAQLSDLEKTQADLDMKTDALLNKTKDLQASEKMKRMKRKPSFPNAPYDPDTDEKMVRPKEEDPDDPDVGKDGKEKGEATAQDKAAKDKPDDDEEMFMPALGGPKPKIDPRFAKKLRPVNKTAKKGAQSAAEQRQELTGRQEEKLGELAQAQASLASDKQTLESMMQQLRQAMQKGSQSGQKQSSSSASKAGQQASALGQLMQAPSLQQALAMASRMRGMQQTASRSQGQPNSAGTRNTAATGNLQGSPPPGSPLEGELGKLDPDTRRAILRLQPKLRDDLLQSMREEGPEGYREFIEDYFKRLTRENNPKGR